ncbi:hypothetical protein GH714_014607 [Hevea brasiliensis]|uniref:Anthocyanidin 3-O-glucosyltransferase n=1 Tax=Hevea brasiliensis TaxID=3981 RepID=A0A6A6L2P6_HEVBR|nr:hypothetical protein GH714_014607 [Hevea brasiliensis]
MIPKFLHAINLLEQPFTEILEECQPDCLVADMLFPWATGVASKLGIPRLYFNGTSFFAMCVLDSVRRFEPYKRAESDFEPFVVPGLPDLIKKTKLQLPTYFRDSTEQNLLREFMGQIWESDLNSYGVLMNSFRELEPAYSEHYRKKKENEVTKEWLAEGFEKRMEGKGLIIRGWAPQLLILEHEAVGDLLKIGVAVGAQEWSRHEKKILVKKEDIEKSMSRLMVGEEAEEIRNRAMALKEMARRATEEGSSYSDVNALLEELRALKRSKEIATSL